MFVSIIEFFRVYFFLIVKYFIKIHHFIHLSCQSPPYIIYLFISLLLFSLCMSLPISPRSSFSLCHFVTCSSVFLAFHATPSSSSINLTLFLSHYFIVASPCFFISSNHSPQKRIQIMLRSQIN